MEFYDDTLLFNVAWAGANGTVWNSAKVRRDRFPADWATKFHVWRMDWDENEIRLSVDGRVLNTTDLRQTVNADAEHRNPLRQPHHVILNLAVGGQQGGDPSATAFPARFEVDWVRVYQRAADAR